MGTLEALASCAPELLSHYLSVVKDVHLRRDLEELAEFFEVDISKLHGLIMSASHDLDQLEKARAWKQPSDALSHSYNIAALFLLTQARKKRVLSASKCRRLTTIERKLTAEYDLRATRRWVVKFIS